MLQYKAVLSTVNRGLDIYTKNLWEAGGSETCPWLNEGEFTPLSLGTGGPAVSPYNVQSGTLTWPFIKLVLCPKLPL